MAGTVHSGRGRLLLLLSLLLACIRHGVAELDASMQSLTFHIEQSLDRGKTFLPRTAAQLVMKPDGRWGIMFEDKNTVSGEAIAGLRQLLQSNDLYTIRMKSSEQPDFVVASIPACELQKSGFKEDIQIFMTGNTINGLSYSSPQMTIPHPCDPAKLKDSVQFQTRIKMGEEVNVQALPLQASGPRPMYLKDIRLGLEEEKQAAQQPGSQSFLSKYWYVVLGLVIYMFLGGSGGDAQARGQGQQPAAGEKSKTQ